MQILFDRRESDNTNEKFYIKCQLNKKGPFDQNKFITLTSNNNNKYLNSAFLCYTHSHTQ